MVTMIYAKCTEGERVSLCSSIYIMENINFSWLFGGDFNTILNEEEKIGGLPIIK